MVIYSVLNICCRAIHNQPKIDSSEYKGEKLPLKRQKMEIACILFEYFNRNLILQRSLIFKVLRAEKKHSFRFFFFRSSESRKRYKILYIRIRIGEKGDFLLVFSLRQNVSHHVISYFPKSQLPFVYLGYCLNV